MTAINAYVFRLIIGRFGIILAIIVAILMLENTTRLLDMVDGVDAPSLMIAQMLVALTPEYLAIGILFSLFLAIALTVRALCLTGEWQILAAAGMALPRQLAVPMVLGLIAMLGLLAVRFEMQPAGEAELVRIGTAAEQGELGIAIDIGTVVDLPGGGVLSVERFDRRTQMVHGLFVNTAGFTATATSGRISRDDGQRIILRLRRGQIWRQLDRAGTAPASFATMTLAVNADRPVTARPDDSVRMGRMNWQSLRRQAAIEAAYDGPQPALAALAMRVVNALFCLVLPIFAVALGELPPRQTTGYGIGAGILVIVIFLRGSAYVERSAAAAPLFGASAYLAVWLLLGGLAAYALSSSGASGRAEQALSTWLNRPARAVMRLVFGR